MSAVYGELTQNINGQQQVLLQSWSEDVACFIEQSTN